MGAMVDQVMFFAGYFKSLILCSQWNSLAIINQLKLPILFVTGSEDELVPHAMTIKLHSEATSSVHNELYIVMGGTHNDTWYVGGKYYI